jgi:hypothetical protein
MENPLEEAKLIQSIEANDKLETLNKTSEASLLSQEETKDAVKDLQPALEAIMINTEPKEVQKVKLEIGEQDEIATQFFSMLKGKKGDKGDKGDSIKGDKGDTGEQGIQGEKGEKGDKGDRGEKGDRGITGEKGEKGEKGDKGEDGKAGKAGTKGKDGSPDTAEQIADKINTLSKKIDFKVIKNFPDFAKNNGGNGIGYIREASDVSINNVVNGQALVWNGSAWVNGTVSSGGGTPGGSDTQLQYNNAGSFGGITGATTDGTSVTYATGGLKVNNILGATSAGILLESNSGTDVALFGAGGGAGATFYGGVNLDTMTQGSVLFAGASGAISQDNANYFWDNTNKRLGIGTATPGARATIVSTGADGLLLGQDPLAASISSRIFFQNSSNLFALVASGNYFDIRHGAVLGSSTGTTIASFRPTTINYGTNTSFESPRYIIPAVNHTTFGIITAADTWAFNLGQNATNALDIGLYTTDNSSSNTRAVMRVGSTFAPTSGSATRNNLSIAYTINATGTTSGATVNGLLMNVTETSVTGTTSNLLNLRTNDSTRFRVTSTGSIIQTSTVNEALVINGNSGTAVVTIGANGILDSSGGQFTVRANTGIPLLFRANATEYMRITTAGNVGIGTTTPTAVLEVKADGNKDILKLVNSAGNTAFQIDNNTLNAKFWPGSGATPGISFFNDTNTGFQGGGDILGFLTGGVRQMTILGNGNVGIGTTSPGAMLQLNTSSAATIGQIIQASASQTANLLEWQNSSGTVLGQITAGGNLTMASGNLSVSNGNASIVGTLTQTGGYPNAAIIHSIGPSINATSGASKYSNLAGTFAPTSGTGTLTGLDFLTTINQTGGANGITRGIYINPTLTSAADFRAIDIANNSGIAINQTGANATNNFAGATTFGASISTAYTAKTANYTATIADYTIDCTANTFTVTLPTAVGITGRIYVIKNTGTGVITVDGDSTETIDGQLTQTLNQWNTLKIQSTGANWIII